MQQQGGQAGLLGLLLPMAIVLLPIAFVFKSIARRKGVNPWTAFIFGFIPYVNVLYGIHLASLIDSSVKSKLNIAP